MQLNMSFKSLVVLILLGVGGYFIYDMYFAGTGGDMAKLMRSYRRESARRPVIKLRIMTIYNRARDYKTVLRELESHSPDTQALAVEILTEKVERGAVPKLVEMLNEPTRAEGVKAALATAMGTLGVHETIPRLVELTDRSETPAVRSAAHSALQRLTDAGAQVKLGDGTREQWENWLRSRRVTGVR